MVSEKPKIEDLKLPGMGDVYRFHKLGWDDFCLAVSYEKWDPDETALTFMLVLGPLYWTTSFGWE
jgi:hypothetical protein